MSASSATGFRGSNAVHVIRCRLVVAGAASGNARTREVYTELPDPYSFAALSRELFRNDAAAADGTVDLCQYSGTGIQQHFVPLQGPVPAAFYGGNSTLEVFVKRLPDPVKRIVTVPRCVAAASNSPPFAKKSEDSYVDKPDCDSSDEESLPPSSSSVRSASASLDASAITSTSVTATSTSSQKESSLMGSVLAKPRGILKKGGSVGTGRRLSWAGVSVCGDDSFESLEQAEQRQLERSQEEAELSSALAKVADADDDDAIDVDDLLGDISFSSSDDEGDGESSLSD